MSAGKSLSMRVLQHFNLNLDLRKLKKNIINTLIS